jgi:hypothetical protein
MDVIGWLCDGDPAIRWQAMRDLGDAAPSAIAAERARVAREGLGAAILARQESDGVWRLDGQPDWVPTLYTMKLLYAIGIDPADAAEAMARLAAGFRWHESLGGKSFFDGETEPCINGGALASGAWLGQPSHSLARRLLDEQLGGGGWNCDAPKSTRSSFHSTICVLEGLLEYERASEVTTADARRRGEEYLLERALFRKRSTGEVAHPSFLALRFPERYRYDVLRGLDYFRNAGRAPDPRVAEAIGLVESKRQADGTWRLEDAVPDGLDPAWCEKVGAASRWITLRALRVLRWYEAG